MKSLQAELDNCQNSEIHLTKEIYLAPVVITRSCRIHGNGAVILCRENEDIKIQADNVELNNLIIEPEDRDKCVKPLVQCKQDTVFKNVIIHGTVSDGFNTNDDSELPSVFDLGEFKADTANTFSMELTVDEACTISSTASCIKVVPEQLNQGKNVIELSTSEIRDEVLIYAKLLLVGKVTREIIVRGKAANSAVAHNDSVVTGQVDFADAFNDSLTVNLLPPNVKENKLNILKKGQRTTIGSSGSSGSSNSEVKIQLAFDNKTKPFDIDGYVFLLDEQGKTHGDNNLIFWGNKVSDDGAVIMTDTGTETFFSVHLDKVSESIKKIDICYSIYGDDVTETFRYVENPYIRFLVDGIEQERFPLTDLQTEKTIVAVEIYRYKGDWKLNCIGSGFRDGLKRLCEEYGLEVIG